MFWAEHESAEAIRAVPLGKARKRQAGSNVTLIAWGNTVEKALEAIQQIENEASIELIDLRSISPWDRETVEESVRKTGRVIIIQEDTENCSVGQMIIAHLMSQTDLWSKIVSPPILVSKGNVMIGYNPIYEYAALPDVQKIVAAIRKSISMKQKRLVVAAASAAESDDGGRRARPYSGREPQPRPATAATTRDPALSPTITRKLSRVIPANLQIDARWDAIRKARDVAKKKNDRNAPSPSVMMAWAVVRAMEKHAPFRRLVLEDETIVENENFDLGIAVAIEGDRLATAVITEANRKSWDEFAEIYRKTVDETRAGRVDAMNAPVVISSLGAVGLRSGAPVGV